MGGSEEMTDGVAAALGCEIAVLADFVALLEEEQQRLTNNDSDALIELAARKEAASRTLEELGQQREAALITQYGQGGRAGIERWLAQPDSDGELWQRLLSLAAEARNLNQINGRLIGLRLQHNQKALNALMTASNRAVTYGPDGQQRLGSGGRMLGCA